MPGDLRAGRDPPAERPLRRQARPSAGGRNRRSAGAFRARRLLSAGGRSGDAVQGCRARVRRAGFLAGAGPPPRRSRDAHRAGSADRHVPDHPERSRRARRGRDAAPRARHDPFGRRLFPTDDRALGGRPAPRRRRAERRHEDRDARGGRGAGRCGRGRRGRRVARRRRCEGAAREGGAPGRSAVRDRFDRAPRHAAELGHDDGLRHPADGRVELSLLGVPSGGGARERCADRSRWADAGHPVSDGGTTRRRRPGHAARADSAPAASVRPRMARAVGAGRCGLVEP